MGLVFSVAGDEMADVIAQLIRTAFARQAEILGLDPDRNPTYVGFDSPDRVRRRIVRGETIVVAREDGEPVGTVAYTTGEDAEIRRLAVLPSDRARGHGPALMGHVETLLREAGVRTVKLGIVARFLGLRHFYEQLGYVVDGHGQVPTLPFGITRMSKTLEDPAS